MSLTISKEGKVQESFKEWKQELISSIDYNKENITKSKEYTKKRIEDLKKEMEKVKQENTTEISRQKRIMDAKKEATKETYEKEVTEALDFWKEHRKKQPLLDDDLRGCPE